MVANLRAADNQIRKPDRGRRQRVSSREFMGLLGCNRLPLCWKRKLMHCNTRIVMCRGGYVGERQVLAQHLFRLSF